MGSLVDAIPAEHRLMFVAIALVLIICASLGFAIRLWWTILIPLLIGSAGAILLLMGGYELGDTPIPFYVAMATAAIAVGVALRSRWRHAR
jgi:hypothetical protein